jgi:hypothetical protein
MQPYLSAPEKHVRFQPRPGNPPNAQAAIMVIGAPFPKGVHL